MAKFKIKYPSRCYNCGRFLEAGTYVNWHKAFGHSCADRGVCDMRAETSKALDTRRSLCENQGSEKCDQNQGGSDE